MAGKDQDSPPPSSTFLPLANKLRRASVSSIASLFDKQAINQTLDQIHTSASQSDSLTTFNDYAPPPSASSKPESKSNRPSSPAGIGSWYSRMRDSVSGKGFPQGNAASIASSRPPPLSTGRPSAAVTSSTLIKSTADIKPQDEVAVQSPIPSPELRRAQPKSSDQSKSVETISLLSNGDKVIVHNSSTPSVQASSHRHVLSNSSHNSISSSQELRKESMTGRDMLKKAMTPDPSAPSSPLLSGDGGSSRKAASITLTQVPSRTGSVSSTTSVRKRKEDSSSISKAKPKDLLGPEISKLTRLASVHDAHEVGISKESSAFSDLTEHSEEAVPETRPTAKRNTASQEDAIAALKRLQSQGLGSASKAAQTQTVGATLNQLRNRVLSRQYWMKDENAKDCFCCGDPFSTFRRKHHCRTCGQIFDAKCMTDVPGVSFGQSGKIRVCKPCENVINGYDESSEYTDDDTASIMTAGFRRRHNSKDNGDASPTRPSTPSTPGFQHHASRTNLNNFKAYLSGPMSRRVDDLKRTSGQYDDDSDRRSIRPMSSRSLKSSHGMRPHVSGHRRHHSRHLLQRGARATDDDRAPFYQSSERSQNETLPAFHSDSVIDPALADFASNDEDSDEEDQSIAAALSGSKSGANRQNGDISTPSTPLLRRPQSRYGDRRLASRRSEVEFDAQSISSGKNYPIGHLRRRNVSFTGGAKLGSPPKPQRLSVAAHQWSTPSVDGIYSSIDTPTDGGGAMIRSVSLQTSAAPSLELNNASLRHGHRLLRQMLDESDVPQVDVWEKALMPILLRATDDVIPNVQAGDAINITNYVKMKKVPGGKPGDTGYVSGVVFSKNLALKSMPRRLARPNILILTFAIEYSRAEMHFMSLAPVIRQEREYLENLVNRIAASKPTLLLVQRHVSGLALELLQKAGIATAHNVKRSVLEAISRCCQTRIITSMDKLATMADTQSMCESFHLRSFLHKNTRRTYMYLSGCPKELGCTIILRGASTAILRRVKRIMEFMLQAIYNLRLETSLVRDEFALIPHYGAEGTIRYDPPSSSLAPSTMLTTAKNTAEASVVATDAQPTSANPTSQQGPTPADVNGQSQMQDSTVATQKSMQENGQDLIEDIPAPTFYSDLVDKQRTRIISTSPFVKFMQPYLLMRARESETRLNHLKKLLDQDAEELAKSQNVESNRFSLISTDMINETVKGASRKVREILQAVHESEYDKATHIYQTQAKQWENSVAGNSDMFNPLSHQSITVLHSLTANSTNIACSGPDVFTIRFYDDHTVYDGTEPDCTLGQYVEDTCISADAVCGLNGCEKRLFEHRRSYVHGEGKLEVTIERSPSKAPGLEDIALMWSACRKCGKETQTLPMSANTWNYSFGKYLELAFWSIPLRPRADICPHDLHRDHWRFFGFQNWALRFEYNSTPLLEVIVPRTRITWKVTNDLKFKNENFKKAERRLNKFLNSVKDRLKSIRLDTLAPDKIAECRQELERLMLLISEDGQAIHKKLQEKYVDSKFYEIVPFNRALRFLHEKACEWDEIFQDIELNYFPSEKDISRLASLQIKKMFLDREESGASLTSPDGTANTSLTEELTASDISPDPDLSSPSPGRILSPQRAEDLLASVVENDAGIMAETDPGTGVAAMPEAEQTQSMTPTKAATADPTSPVVQHLDLAVSPSRSPRPTTPNRAQTFASPPTSPKSPLALQTHFDAEVHRPSLDETSLSVDTDSEAGATRKKKPKISGIPRFADLARRRKLSTPASLQRSQSQPANGRQILKGLNSRGNTPQRSPVTPNFDNSSSEALTGSSRTTHKTTPRFSMAGMKERGQSLIPRSIATKTSTRVSALTKHFEQLSKEFERQRLKDQQRRALRTRQGAVYPTAALKPIVEVYRNVQEAINESDTDLASPKADDSQRDLRPGLTVIETARNLIDATKGDGFHAEGSPAMARHEDKQVGDGATEQSESEPTHEIETTDVEADEDATGIEEKLDDSQEAGESSMVEGEEQDQGLEDDFDPEVELPKHEKTSLMKMLTNFWAERSSSGWASLYYPLRDIDHVFANSDIIVREDEPSSLVALALDHGDYHAQMRSIGENSASASMLSEKEYVDDLFLTAEEQRSIEKSLLQDTGHHLSYQFERGPAKMQCKIFWAEQFEAVRKKCGVSERIVESLSRCLKWDSKGGKTKSVFLKTLDDRFILKSLSPIETRSFLRFAPFYFNLMGQALFHELPSLIAKMLGFYQVTIKNPVTGTDFDWYLLLMENLFYDRTPKHIFDLKGSMRNRRITPSGEQNEVLLDENMVDFIAENPIYSREHSKKLLRSSVYNDTLFLARRNVMDYSLMLGIDERDGRGELVVGIIDCIRTYTWDKKIETWMKDRGKNRPTVTEPKDYKNRFREAINRYVFEAPTCWHFPGAWLPAGGGGGDRRGLPRTGAEVSMMTEKEDDMAGTLEDGA